MLELISWLVRQLEEALFWLHNKEKDAAVKRHPFCAYFPVISMMTISGGASVLTGGPQKP